MPLSRVKPEHYDALLEDKVTTVSRLLAPFDTPAPEIFRSPKTGFRQRAEFRIWHEGDDLNYVMFRRDDPKTPIAITDFPIADERIQTLMPILRENVRDNDTLRHKLFQVEFLSTLAGDLLVTLVYHRKLDEHWEEQTQALRTKLDEMGLSCAIIGRSRKQKVVLGDDHVTEVLEIHGKRFTYRQYEQAFSQPNATVNIAMIEWACTAAKDLAGDLLELYCGNGNFTLPLAQYFPRVLATELSKVSVRAARHNIAANLIDNIGMVRLSAEEVSQAMAAERVFRRLAELPVPLSDYNLRSVFVDPPRAGLDQQTLDMVANFDNILYISCNPQTLADNLLQLHRSHSIKQFALFDQFPYTDHMECGVLLVKKD
jgi:tRNA (uracil-5-)-methyltransferase